VAMTALCYRFELVTAVCCIWCLLFMQLGKSENSFWSGQSRHLVLAFFKLSSSILTHRISSAAETLWCQMLICKWRGPLCWFTYFPNLLLGDAMY